MITVPTPCLTLKHLFKHKQCFLGTVQSSLLAERMFFSLIFPPRFLFNTPRCEQSDVYPYTHSTEVSNYTYTHGEKHKSTHGHM